MADSLRDLVVSLSLNTDNFTRNIKSVNKQIQEAESYFKLASAGVNGFDASASGLSSKLEMLERKLSLQKDAVGQYEKALEAASSKLTECYTRQEDYANRLTAAKQKQSELAGEVEKATSQYEHYKRTLGETDSATIAAKQNMEAAQQEYAQASAEVEKLAGQNDALQRSTQNAADAVSTAQTQLNKAQAAVKETEAAIKQTNQELKTAQSTWTAAGKALEDFSKKAEKVGKSATQIGKSLTTTISTPILGLATTAIKASVDFESAFAGVRKTVDASEAEFDQLAGSIKQMSTEVAASTTDIASVVETAGQLGIENSHLMDFARTMIDLGNSTNMQADEAASQAARFANIMGMSQGEFQNLGSTLVDLGNNYATT
ncbi:MAG: phage tail tape measure protein, partial [Clostridia bacterium]|nr:phage tail tape measure protein [Clostridia bacterium]